MKLINIYSPIEKELQEVNDIIKKELLATENKFLLEFIKHLLKTSGKKLRPSLIFLSLKANDTWNPKAIPVAAAIEIIHTATLVHDDILDRADLRRGQISVNSRWGSEMALLLGDYLYFKAFSLLSKINEMQVSQVVSKTAQRICEGETTQNCRAFDTKIKEEDYMEIIVLKTAFLMAACCEIGSILAKAPSHTKKTLINYGLNFGIAFQILDDCIDILNISEKADKTLGKDIQQGKLTLPLIYLKEAIEKEDNKVDIDRLFSNREEVVDLLKEYEITRLCLERINSLLNKAEKNLSVLSPSPAKESLLSISGYLREKSSKVLLARKQNTSPIKA